MKTAIIIWALWIGTADELGTRIAAYRSLAACHVAAAVLVPQDQAASAHCVPESKK